MFRLSCQPIDVNQCRDLLSDHRAGAYVSFEGRVRNHNEGRAVDSLEYEAYEELSLSEGNLVLEEAKARFDLHGVAAVHRTGHLQLGDVAVWVGVVSSHRQEAFEACRYVIDEIKHRLPIWKCEHYNDGTTEWVNCQSCGGAGDTAVAPSGCHAGAGSSV